MGLLSRALELFRGGRRAALSRARREEALGRVEEATALYLEAGAPAEAARLFALRADAAVDPERRHLLLGQALAHATGEQARAIEARRCKLELELLQSGASRSTRDELIALGRRLFAVNEPALAAEAHALAGDREGEARMLVEAGAIEKLESVLDADQEQQRAARARREAEQRVRDLALSGRRREALSQARSIEPLDAALGSLVSEIEQRRVLGPTVLLRIDGQPRQVLLGDEVVIGRAGATLSIASPALSRHHLAIRRGAAGPEALDLGSRNHTLLRGARIDAPVAVGDGIELSLGGEVPVRIEPSPEGGVRIETPELCAIAPLGPLRLAGWELSAAEDGWLELDASSGAWLGGLRVSGRIQLGSGDELRESADGPCRLRVSP